LIFPGFIKLIKSNDNNGINNSSENTVLEVLKKIFIINPIPQNMRDYSPLSKILEQDGSNIAGVLAALPEPEKEKIEHE
jgi:hypothetical protein